ncbi:MAG TPA: hypothetical protein IGR64_15965 [Leptolyngbyaceae cyanobacterium M65_K2018_010]|nr:hypothetical protein [Leptolyngbyaceae cyanobacterium M65_K2018_010]
MYSELSLAPRYRLDDESAWLQGVDPLRRYWIFVNGDGETLRSLPGLSPSNFETFRQAIRSFRAMTIGETLTLPAELGQELTIICVAENCYALADPSRVAPVWHLFDREALESLLMTAHPDWQCAPHHLELGRSLLTLAWGQPVAVKAA